MAAERSTNVNDRRSGLMRSQCPVAVTDILIVRNLDIVNTSRRTGGCERK
jgi:hypothetical protein